jgi:hypothetical protein
MVSDMLHQSMNVLLKFILALITLSHKPQGLLPCQQNPFARCVRLYRNVFDSYAKYIGNHLCICGIYAVLFSAPAGKASCQYYLPYVHPSCSINAKCFLQHKFCCHIFLYVAECIGKMLADIAQCRGAKHSIANGMQ